MAGQTIVQGPLHFGDTPMSDLFQGMPFVGLEQTFAFEVASVDADELTLAFHTRMMEILTPTPGHQVFINDHSIGYLNNQNLRDQPTIHTLSMARAILMALLGDGNVLRLKIKVEDVGLGVDDDFVLDRIEAFGITTRAADTSTTDRASSQPVAKPVANSEITVTVVPSQGRPPSQRITNIPWQPGTTVLGAMVRADAISPFTLTFRVLFASVYGALIDMIDGLDERDGFYWLPYLNGQLSDLGVSTILVPGGPGAPNAEIEWRFERITEAHPGFAHVTRKAQVKTAWFRV